MGSDRIRTGYEQDTNHGGTAQRLDRSFGPATAEAVSECRTLPRHCVVGDIPAGAQQSLPHFLKAIYLFSIKTNFRVAFDSCGPNAVSSLWLSTAPSYSM